MKKLSICLCTALLLANGAVAKELTRSAHSPIGKDEFLPFPTYFEKVAHESFGKSAQLAETAWELTDSFISEYTKFQAKLAHFIRPIIVLRITPNKNRRGIKVYYNDFSEQYYPILQKKLSTIAHIPANVLMKVTPLFYAGNLDVAKRDVAENTRPLLQSCIKLQHQLPKLGSKSFSAKTKALITTELKATIAILKKTQTPQSVSKADMRAYIKKVRPVLNEYLKASVNDLNKTIKYAIDDISQKVPAGSDIYIVHAVGASTPGLNTVSKRVEDQLHKKGFKTYTINTVDHGQPDTELRDMVIGDILAENYLRAALFGTDYGIIGSESGGISTQAAGR